LRLQAHVADLVEKNRAFVGLLELANLFFRGAGERPLLVAEQLRLDQVVGDRRAVHLHEPLTRAKAVAMDGARHQLLADAALASDEDGCRRRRCATDGVEHTTERWPLADEVVASLLRLAQRDVLVNQTMPVERVAYGDEDALGGERLLDEIEGTELRRLDRRAHCRVSRNHHDGQRLVGALQPLQHFEAVHTWHLDIEEDEIRQIAIGDDQTVLAGRGALHLVAFVLENHFQRVADR
jgi:hypothetical protein